MFQSKLISPLRILAIASIFFSAYGSASILNILNSTNSQYFHIEKNSINNNINYLLLSHRNRLAITENPVDIKEKIMEEYQDWKGVRYHFGGNSRRGIDCSAFVQRIFRKQFSFNLPRTSRAQITRGSNIARAELRSGDIIMFHTNEIDRHVGIYLGNDEFVHVSREKGVIISKLSNSYWNEHYNSARRLLNV